jgi:hypothetical protein
MKRTRSRHKNKGKETPSKHSSPDRRDQGEAPGSQAPFFDQTTDYIKDPETGRWVIVNPSGSELYNNLYRDKKDRD